jgi:hypothetical protein
VVLSTGHLVGLDQSGALIPAGLFCGTQADKAYGGQYCLVVYGADDVGFAMNPQKGTTVQSAGEYVVLACPADAVGETSVVAGDTVTLPNGTVIHIQPSDIAFAESCTLVPGGYSRPIGYCVRNVFQYLGGVNILNASPFTGGIQYVLDGVNPVGFRAHNYMHEMGTAIATKFVIRVPWIGPTLTSLQTWANANLTGLGYVQTDFSRSFAHFTATAGSALGDLFAGCSVVASRGAGSGTPAVACDSGNYAPYNPNVNYPDEICGRVLAVEHIYPILDYANRVRTQFERANEQIGPFREPNAVIGLMGGSATRGIDYAINLSTNGLFRLAKDNNQVANVPAYAYTYVYIHISC